MKGELLKLVNRQKPTPHRSPPPLLAIWNVGKYIISCQVVHHSGELSTISSGRSFGNTASKFACCKCSASSMQQIGLGGTSSTQVQIWQLFWRLESSLIVCLTISNASGVEQITNPFALMQLARLRLQEEFQLFRLPNAKMNRC